MPTITRRFEFDAGHRVLGHESKCRHLHGHRYVAEVTVTALELDALGRVVDFSVIKEKVGKWIDDNWDHNILLNSCDPLYAVWEHPHLLVRHATPSRTAVRAADIFAGKQPYVMDGNPTAENIAAALFDIASQLLNRLAVDLSPAMRVTRVRIYETPSCWADYPDKN